MERWGGLRADGAMEGGVSLRRDGTVMKERTREGLWRTYDLKLRT